MIVLQQSSQWLQWGASMGTDLGTIDWTFTLPAQNSSEQVLLYDSIVQYDVLHPHRVAEANGEKAVTHVAVEGKVTNRPQFSRSIWTGQLASPFYGTRRGENRTLTEISEPFTLYADPALLHAYTGCRDGLIESYEDDGLNVSVCRWLKETWSNYQYTITGVITKYDNGQWYYQLVSIFEHDYSERDVRMAAAQRLELFLNKLKSPTYTEWRKMSFSNIEAQILPAPEPTKVNITEWATCLPEYSLGELANDAYSSVNFFEGNGFAYITDMLHISEDFKKYVRGATQIHNGVPKIAASLFLGFIYGWKLTVADSLELVDQSRRLANADNYTAGAMRRNQHHDGELVERIKISYDPFGQLRSMLDQLIFAADLAIDLGNAWDMIPFSFVADWFVSIGDTLSSIDNWVKLQKFCTFRRGTISQKWTGTRSSYQIGPWRIPVTFTVYRRSPLVEFPDPVIPISTTPLTQTLQNHYKEGAALVVTLY